jgi:hypothetical protein
MLRQEIDTDLGRLTNLSTLSNQGGNSELYLGDLGSTQVIYKQSNREDAEERATQEFENLKNISLYCSAYVPTPICLSSNKLGIIMTYVKGVSPNILTEEVSTAMIIFLGKLRDLGAISESQNLFKDATDSVIRDGFGIDQLKRRLKIIVSSIKPRDLILLKPIREAITRYEDYCYQLQFKEKSRIVLSPSDFGIHNMLWEDSEVPKFRFVDFEYLGWDRPEKLVSDTLLHPRNLWDSGVSRRFLNDAIDLYSLNLEYLQTLLNFSRLNWTLIGLRRSLEKGTISSDVFNLAQLLDNFPITNEQSVENTLQGMGL